jgi:hypothetical protein
MTHDGPDNRHRIRDWLRKWLLSDLVRRFGALEVRTDTRIAELTSLSADVSVYGESTIVIISRIGGGRVRIINAKFSGLADLNDFMRYCEARYGARINTVDAPLHDPRMRY